MKVAVLSVALISLIAATSCGTGSHSSCTVQGLGIRPATGTADHIAAAPGNSVQFSADWAYSSGCVLPAVFRPGGNAGATWTTSNPAVATISNVNDMTNGTATCIAASPDAVTVTATAVMPGSGETKQVTASLTCR